MLQITEDTPPDMLAGAMDLIVHLPNGNSVKMSVERSTPMMDLLVQITTNHHLQLSGYTLQPLEMVPTTTGYCNDKILPFKPNTPIGVLDTQHIRVVPKIKTIPKTLQKSSSIISNNSNNNHHHTNGYHQPFESTFRLKVYLPRNQLYVTRISQNVYLEDILKKVCDEKHLDPQKYEFRHPGNLDEILDPKLTLSDYQITELYLVVKGTIGLQQTFATNDLMSLRKEEERKQMHNKTGGGVFNLIFRRGKTSSGSVSSENRSISPTHSDDSRSVTPPGVVVSSSTLPTPSSISSQQKQMIVDKPKPPQRKRRPAPKPPQINEIKETITDPPPPTTTQTTTKEVETTSTTTKKLETGLTICHSRNSSDSSGYHEASVLSDNCGNTSLPRRPRSTTIDNNDDNNNKNGKNIGKFSQSTSNLSKMSIQSKSTSSLTITGRKKKTAPPPPPPVVKQTNSTIIDNNNNNNNNKQPPSPVVASQNTITTTTTNIENQKTEDLQGDGPVTNPNPPPTPPPFRLLHNVPKPAPRNKILNNPPIFNDNNSTSPSTTTTENKIELYPDDRKTELQPENEDKQVNEAVNQTIVDNTNTEIINDDDDNHKESIELEQQPEILAILPNQSMFDSLTRKRGFQIGSSLLNDQNDNVKTISNTSNDVNNNNNDDDELITNDELFNVSLHTNTETTILNQLHGIHDYDRNKSKNFKKTLSVSSLRSITSIPGFLGNTNMKKWDNIEELDDISLQSVKWVIGGDKNTEFSDNSIQKMDDKIDEKPISDIESSGKTANVDDQKNLKGEIINGGGGGGDFEPDWQYQLPSPPKAFRDSSPPSTFTNYNDNLTVDSVVTSPELFEKLQSISDNQTEKTDSNFSDIDDNKSILNKLSLENLEKRKSLVYNRELATSLKQQQQEKIVEKDKNTTTKTNDEEDYVDVLLKFEKTLDELQEKPPSSQQQQQKKETITKSTLPNFKITTYDNPKQKLNIFEDDTVHSNRKFDKNNTNQTTTRRNSNDGKSSNLLRTESFQQNYWSPVKPVTRSKSSIALNKYNQNTNRDINNKLNNNNNNNNNEENLIKSNSLFDVSGLQSLGVMRLIQSKLNTPRNSIGENLNDVDHIINNKNYQKQSDDKIEVQNNNSNNSINSNNNSKTDKSYQYITATPSINMGTWSERPKIPVNLKNDPDYKFNTNNRRSVFNNNGVNVRISSEYKNVSIKVNGSEPISAENSGNVVIKIGEQQQQQQNRKPLGNVNKIETTKQRPHSIAFDNDFDISRLPIVRSVELKKPYKDLQNNNNNTNTSITQINDNKTDGTIQQQKIEPKFRLNSFVQNSAPVVRGFRNNDNYRFSWNQPHSYSSTTLKNQEKSSQQQQQSIFQVNLRRTESTKMMAPPPPPPPVAPLQSQQQQPLKSTKSAKIRDNCSVDPKEQLLQAIRDFGGKKGLRPVKA